MSEREEKRNTNKLPLARTAISLITKWPEVYEKQKQKEKRKKNRKSRKIKK